MAVRKIKLSPLSQETGNLTNDSLSERRRNRNLIRDNKGNSTLIDQTAEQVQILASSVSTVEGRVTNTEATITQQAGQIALKAEQSTVDTVSAVANSKAKTFLSTPTTPYYVGDIWVDTNATTGANRVCTTQRLTGAYVASDWTKEGVTSRLDSAELKITPTAITSTVRSSTEYTNDLGGKENTVFKQNTAPAHLNGRFWLNTSVVPNILNVSNGTAWIKATPTQASEVDAYSSGQVDTILTSYSTITQTASEISLQFNNVAEQTRMNGVEVFPQGWRNKTVGWTNPLNAGTVIPTSDWGINDNLFMLRIGGVQFARSIYIPHVAGASYHITLRNTYFENAGGTFYVGLEFYTDIDVSSGSNDNTIYAIQMTPTVGTQSLLQGTINSSQYNTAQNSSRYVRVRILTYHGSSLTGVTLIRDISVKRLGTPTQMQGAKYNFDGSKARFYGDGQEWYDSSGNLKVSFDTVNNRFKFNGEIIADSGSIADFSLIPNYATIVAGTSGKALTAGSGASRVGVSPGVLATNGFRYAFWVGNDSPNLAPFRVVVDGSVRCDNLVSGGWTMSGSSISRGNMSLNASETNGNLNINNVVLSSSSGGLLSITGSIALSGDIRPTSTNFSDIGTSTIRYRLIYLTNNPNVSSDIRWKENVKVVEDEYKDMILNAEIIEYNLIGSENKQIGINANKFHEQFGGRAELITKLDENGYYGADYVSFVPMLIKTVQKMEKRISELESRI